MSIDESGKEMKCSIEDCERKADFGRKDTGEGWCEEHFWKVHNRITSSDKKQRDGYA
ncbi:MAG: hypothetical protein V5A57_01540 [Candidatus Paceibacterota bacterium]